MTRLVPLIIWVLVFTSLCRRLFRIWGSTIQKGRSDSSMGRGEDMVKDPLCNTYVPKKGAVEEKIRGTLYYFCSPVCAEGFRKKLLGTHESA